MTAALLACALLLAGQQAPPPAAPPAPELPVSLDRIQRALSAPPAIDFKEQNPVFRLEVFGRKPTLEDILGEKFWIGPTPYGGMTHSDYLNMVTPELFRRYPFTVLDEGVPDGPPQQVVADDAAMRHAQAKAGRAAGRDRGGAAHGEPDRAHELLDLAELGDGIVVHDEDVRVDVADDVQVDAAVVAGGPRRARAHAG